MTGPNPGNLLKSFLLYITTHKELFESKILFITNIDQISFITDLGTSIVYVHILKVGASWNFIFIWSSEWFIQTSLV